MATMITINSDGDVISFLKGQHAQAKAMFDDVLAATGAEREKAFIRLRRLLAVHETAEEEVVHPAARRVMPDGDAIVNKRIGEENKAKATLAQLEKLDLASAEFETRFRSFKDEVIAHAESEEREEFTMLAGHLDAKRLARMKKAAELAEAVAPTRPHPGVESATANLFVGPFASMMDRARDALSAKA
jgi:hemerythrin superfamily protein